MKYLSNSFLREKIDYKNIQSQLMGWYNKLKIANKESWEMTEDEFLKHHYTGFIPSNAYDRYQTSEGLNFIRKSQYPNVYDTKNIGGKQIEFRMKTEILRFVKKDEQGDIVYDENGSAVILTKNEQIELGYPTESHEIAAFIDEQPIGFASNEFGSTGVWVIKEMQNKGIGTKLLYDFRKFNPYMQSKKLGQMTNAGYNLARKYYRKLLQDAYENKKPIPQNISNTAKQS